MKTLLAQYPLRVKLLGIAVLTILILSAGAWISLKSISQSFETKSLQSFETYAGNITKAIAAQFFERYGDIQAFALNDAVRSGNSDRIRPVLQSYVGLYGIYDLILVVDKHGRFVASNLKDASGKLIDQDVLRGYDFSAETWFQAVIDGNTTDDKKNNFSGTYVEDFIKDPMLRLALNEDRFGSSFSSAVRNENGDILGVITNRAGERWIQYDLNSAAQFLNESSFPNFNLFVINEKGRIVQKASRTPDPKFQPLESDFHEFGEAIAKLAMSGQQGAAILPSGKTGREEVVGYDSIDDSKWVSSIKWHVVISDAKEEVLKSVIEAQDKFAVLVTVAALLALTLSIWFSILISKSLNQISATLDSNSTGVNEASLEIAQYSLQLSEANNEQASALQQTMAAVDQINAMIQKNAEAAEEVKLFRNNQSSPSKGAAKL